MHPRRLQISICITYEVPDQHVEGLLGVAVDQAAVHEEGHGDDAHDAGPEVDGDRVEWVVDGKLDLQQNKRAVISSQGSWALAACTRKYLLYLVTLGVRQLSFF